MARPTGCDEVLHETTETGKHPARQAAGDSEPEVGTAGVSHSRLQRGRGLLSF